MGRLSDWNEKTKTFLVEKSRHLFAALDSNSEASKKFISSLGRIRAAMLFLLGFVLSALLIEVLFQYVIPPSAKKSRVEVSSKKLYYLQSRSSYDLIAQKNIFCPGCPIPNLESRKIERPKDCDKAERMGGSVKLIGTIALDVPEFSVATMSYGGPAKSYKVGEQFDRYGKIFEIRRDRVCILKSDDKLAYVELPGIPKFDGVSTSSAPKVVSEGISQASDTDFQIKRDYLMKSLTDMSVLQTAYATPYFEDNEIKGFRIQSIEPGSPLLALGMRPNDIILKADNQPLNSLAKAQEILAGASTLDSLVITVNRNGQEVNLNYKVAK
ncbi:MAG: PDZ domain-containing protein [Bdellovibrionota bacterium]